MSKSKVKFLLVDDIEMNLVALRAVLEREDVELISAKSGPEALELLLDHEFALAILDVQMPDMDGFELAHLMHHSDRTRRIPIVFLTAGGLDEQRRYQGYGAGAVDFLFKPIEADILRSKADVFYQLYIQRQEVERQRDTLKVIASENAELLKAVSELNETLERRVDERTSQLMDANEQLQGFTYSVAHDFRQHIRGISTNASLLLESNGPDLGDHKANVERIKVVATLMGKMTDDLLAYARLRNESLKFCEVDISAVALAAVQTNALFYPETLYDIEEGLVGQGDRTMIRIVFDNLINNAFKYSQNSENALIEIGKDEKGIFVRDNGVGFDMAYADKLFLPFERLHSEDQFGGTGMGLANVKRILERHGGEVWAESELNKGSTFYILLR